MESRDSQSKTQIGLIQDHLTRAVMVVGRRAGHFKDKGVRRGVAWRHVEQTGAVDMHSKIERGRSRSRFRGHMSQVLRSVGLSGLPCQGTGWQCMNDHRGAAQ